MISAISKDEFGRAVKICTGSALSEHLIHTVFAIFDEDGDGKKFNFVKILIFKFLTSIRSLKLQRIHCNHEGSTSSRLEG